ncbi:hypothetical protein J1605_013202 [Eschrichtius robustus]|uniref:Protein lifeguard 3 n=1 Tax=Eschrichtius robustus TaxID=9764 RepID=A0AB34GG91_ESCRO|nr:hypothetical protein J1605_013202 [Eschrichtius robustus]
MSHPSAPPPYEDRNPLYPDPLPPGGYGQPSVLPGGYPAYPQPGYGHPAGYPQPMPPIHPTPMNYGPGQGYDVEERAESPTRLHPKGLLHHLHPAAHHGGHHRYLHLCEASQRVREGKPGRLLRVLCCVPGHGPRRRFPWNIILLTLFTLAMGYMTGTIASVYDTKAVIIAMIITAVVSISVTIFCFQTKVDFTSCTGLFCVLGIVMMVTGIVTAIVLSFKYIYWLHMVYAALGAICFTLFLAYDTQLVLGNRRYTISPEDYITGALQIYTDIVYIFTFVLQLLGDRN